MQQKKLSPADYVIAVLFGTTVIVIGVQIIFRYVFNYSIICAMTGTT